MTDLEGIGNKLIENGKKKKYIVDFIASLYKIFKNNLSGKKITQLSESVFNEIIQTRIEAKKPLIRDLLTIHKSNVSIGEQGVGCRGLGDFLVHDLVTTMASEVKPAILSASSMDDAGAVIIEKSGKKRYIVTKMEGMHSRLSNFPFIAGFHVTRACLRDLYVKGANPISIMVDIHLGDDADVAKLFDYMAGVACVADLAEVPITAGSTLRIGGDMVIGTRITSGIAAVGTCDKLLARKDIQLDCDIIMTEGAGGGTITTTAIYHGIPDNILHTLNIKFLDAMKILLSNPNLLDKIYCCSDVTNGGLRGDLFEILKDSSLGAEVFEDKIVKLVHPAILKMLKETSTDYLGVSLDALLIFCKPNITQEIIQILDNGDIKANKIGVCTGERGVKFHSIDGGIIPFDPKFRESAYTPVKKIIGEEMDERGWKAMREKIKKSYNDALEKKERIQNWIKRH